MSNIIGFNICFLLIPLLILGLLGLLLGWLIWGRRKHQGDLTIEGEGALRAEADTLRTRVQELEGRVSTRDTEVSDLTTKLAAATVGGAALTAVAATAKPEAEEDTDETYALEWRNRYLAARVKYLESRLSDAPKATPKPAAKAKPAAKSPAKAKAKIVAAAAVPAALAATAKAKPKVLYTDGPTEGAPDDLKLIRGIGPKFEKDLHSKGIYYFRQIAAWKAEDVKMVEGVIDSIPGRIKRDEWVRQAKGFAANGGKVAPKSKASASASATKKVAKPKASAADVALDKYYANVVKFDPKADKDVVKKIVNYCGVALRSRDSSLVACSDSTEVQTVADGFVTKKLGLATGQIDLVKEVCQEMKSQRLKNRVTFYYLAAKKAGKLSVFGG